MADDRNGPDVRFVGFPDGNPEDAVRGSHEENIKNLDALARILMALAEGAPFVFCLEHILWRDKMGRALITNIPPPDHEGLVERCLTRGSYNLFLVESPADQAALDAWHAARDEQLRAERGISKEPS